MELTIWSFYVGTIFVMMSTPGPSHLLILSTSLNNGFSRSLATGIGDLSANIIQILLAGFGLAALLATSRFGFLVIKWAGVAYLIWMGVRAILASFRQKSINGGGERATLKRLWLNGFLTSASNPKAVVFFAALFPQFIDSARPLGMQIFLLGITYLIIDGVFLTGYAFGGSWLSKRIGGQFRPWLDRLAGAGLIGAAILLGLKSR